MKHIDTHMKRILFFLAAVCLSAAAYSKTLVAYNTENTMQIYVIIGTKTFTVTLADSETGRAFAQLLPLTISMTELNGNEKYHYLDSSLPTDSYQPGTIQAGDLMLYGNNCVVLFYETFGSSYSYTRIGSIDDPTGLAAALGSGNVSVRFEKAGTTDLNQVPSDQAPSTKFIENGQVYLKYKGTMYDVRGQQIK